MDTKKIAIFPIPGVVAFPGQVIPLHIFEPRYRQMVEDSLETGLCVGLCIPAGVISKASDRVSSKDMGLKNLTLFKPQKIMGSGSVELVESLKDGRYLVNIKIQEKVEVQKIISETPYCCAEVSVLTETVRDSDYARKVYDELMQLLLQIIGQRKEVLASFNLGSGGLVDLIRNIVSFIYLPDSIRQLILEEDLFEKKAEIILTFMKSTGQKH